jgi:hypothetical protein
MTWSARRSGQNKTVHHALLLIVATLLSPLVGAPDVFSQTKAGTASVVPDAQWRAIDAATGRALDWLASQQRPDGSFPSLDLGQPGVTSLCVLALLAQGHVAGEGPYGDRLERAIEYTLACQQPNGWIGRTTPGGTPLPRNVSDDVGGAAVYNHSIGGLMLAEVFAAGAGEHEARIEDAIRRALRVVLQEQQLRKRRPIDRGGWRYLHTSYPASVTYDSDLSITSWQLKFLRSAKNAGFDVPEQPIDDAVGYVRRCFSAERETFLYAPGTSSDLRSRGMAGAGVLALAMGGLHETPEAQQAGDWILKHDFSRYNRVWPFPGRVYPVDRYHYGVFHCTQAMYQLGGRHWEEFFPPTATTLLANQNRDGSWQAEGHPNEARFGNAYTTALVVLTLSAADQVLPVYQR